MRVTSSFNIVRWKPFKKESQFAIISICLPSHVHIGRLDARASS